QDGSEIPVEIGLNPIEANGELYVVASVIDISERLKSEERFKAAFDVAPSGMLMIDSRRRIVLINKKVEEIFGYSRQELVGSSIEVLVPEDFRGPHPKFVETYMKKPEPRSMGIGRELFGRHKSGNLVPVEVGLQPIWFNGETCVISSIVDISYRKKAEAEIESKTQEIEEFAYRTSHDLRSPLKSIAGVAECIVESIEDQQYDEAKSHAIRISGVCKKLLRLIEDILTLTKVDLAAEARSEFDFNSYKNDFGEKYSEQLEQNDVKFEATFMNTRSLSIENARLVQVLDNLLVNAVKYCDSAKDHRFVRLHTFNDNARFFIHVSDNGIGIPLDRQSEVFGMFKRFYSSSIEGSGLGLYIVKKQIDKLGASISFESSADGTNFYLEFELTPQLHA
ncbi:MAG: PAS domain S-box protein, partial [Bdellovibrionales bacterium]|nr:PAS domain S-box protein [Bdellovibrionales bacterium]